LLIDVVCGILRTDIMCVNVMFSGTYGNGTHLKSSDQCTPCPPGKYCSGKSNKIWDGNCEAGYWCVQGASEKAPTDGQTGDKCSPGYVLIVLLFLDMLQYIEK
jgi:hypothetical protein